MPLLTCMAMSMSVGRTRSGSEELSQMLSGERREDVNSSRRVAEQEMHESYVTRE